MGITQDHDEIQTLTPDTANKTLTVYVGFGSTKGGTTDLNFCPFRHTFKMGSLLVIIVADQEPQFLNASGRVYPLTVEASGYTI
jgi:hypothetical protein